MASLLNTAVGRDVDSRPPVGLPDGTVWQDPCGLGLHLIQSVGGNNYSCMNCEEEFTSGDTRAEA